ncbi:MAG: TerD family protein, partial [Oscillospiraceae bacterium]|nr:TerD family protein [Oscillospiraceae bacterium]
SEPRQVSEAAIEVAAQAIKEMMRAPAPSSAPIAAPASTAPAAPPTPMAHAATDVIPLAGRQSPTSETLDMKRGQRVGLAQYLGNTFEVWFTANAPRGMEIDPYVFLLESGDKAIGDDGLVFFGNERSPNDEVRFFPGDGHIEVDLSKVPPRIQKIALAYSIYDGGAAKNFRSVISPRVSLRAGGERVTFTIDGLTDEATIVALEFYLYKGEWKISAVGAGFKDGLAKLCNRYGIEVE